MYYWQYYNLENYRKGALLSKIKKCYVLQKYLLDRIVGEATLITPHNHYFHIN